MKNFIRKGEHLPFCCDLNARTKIMTALLYLTSLEYVENILDKINILKRITVYLHCTDQRKTGDNSLLSINRT